MTPELMPQADSNRARVRVSAPATGCARISGEFAVPPSNAPAAAYKFLTLYAAPQARRLAHR